jgi:hypothetical protein
MKRWMERVLAVLAIAFLAVYGGDWAVFKLRGSPQDKVTVNRYMAIPLKGNKQEFDFLGTQDAPCSLSLFPQAGLTPCWQLRRNPNQGLKIS